METIRFQVKELARARGWTAEELSGRSGVKLSTIHRFWQNQVANPHYGTVRAIARAMGVPVEALEAPPTE